MEFSAWPSIPRLSKEKVIVTEKLDGTNSCVRIRFYNADDDRTDQVDTVSIGGTLYTLWAQSRTRFLQPTKHDDNFGFARWVYDNAVELVKILGVGDHYGEWWGSKIQNSYGLTNGERRLSLFNAPRWGEFLHHTEVRTAIPNLFIVPLLYSGSLYDLSINDLRNDLKTNGSHAAPGFAAEGMVVYLRELRASYKVLLENDDIHKWEVTK